VQLSSVLLSGPSVGLVHRADGGMPYQSGAVKHTFMLPVHSEAHMKLFPVACEERVRSVARL